MNGHERVLGIRRLEDRMRRVEGVGIQLLNQSVHLRRCEIDGRIRMHRAVAAANVIGSGLVLAFRQRLFLHADRGGDRIGLLRPAQLLVQRPDDHLGDRRALRCKIEDVLVRGQLRLEHRPHMRALCVDRGLPDRGFCRDGDRKAAVDFVQTLDGAGIDCGGARDDLLCSRQDIG